MKKILVSRFITTELKSESSDSDLGSEKARSKFDNEFMAKLEKPGSDSEQNIVAHKWLQIITNKNDSHK